MNKTSLADMSWTEAKQAFSDTDLAFVPLGATESHGPHGLLGTDTYAAQEVADRAAKRSRAISIPALPFGYSDVLMDFPGTITVPPAIYTEMLTSICLSLHKWGIKRVIWVTGHGPNVAPMKEVSLNLRDEHGMIFASPLWYRLVIKLLPQLQLGPDHGGFTETSVAMAIRPRCVDLKAISGQAPVTELPGKFDSSDKYEVGFGDASIDIPMFISERWPQGYWDKSKSAVLSSSTAGEMMLEVVSEYLAQFAAEFRRLPLPNLRSDEQ